jgi:hypothetical protein
MPPSLTRSQRVGRQQQQQRQPKGRPLVFTSVEKSIESSASSVDAKGHQHRRREIDVLREWINHSHADYHNFSRQEATEIRSALLRWYTEHRRKLPWRGDPPPFDGSTSGINTKNGNHKKRKKNDDDHDNDSSKKQKSITSFFTGVKTESQNMTNDDHDEQMLMKEAIPVTGYGVWVSEIMLQQTRVEAVIPYWIKCEYYTISMLLLLLLFLRSIHRSY